MKRRRVAILISGRGSNMQALIAAASSADYPAEVALVVASRAQAAGLQRARALGVKTELLDQSQLGTERQDFERALSAVLGREGIELICLAGFMRVLSEPFVKLWQQRLLNIHPSLLPAFTGLDTHRRVLEAGVKIHGATVHLVAPEVDSGPIIAQAALAVRTEDTAETLAARVLTLEHRIYPAALKLVAQGRIRLQDRRCLIEGVSQAEQSLSEQCLIVPNLQLG